MMKYKAGLLLIVIVVALWVTSCEVTQGIFEDYEHPFVVTYLGTSLLVLYLPIAFVSKWIQKMLRKNLRQHSNPNTTQNQSSSPQDHQRTCIIMPHALSSVVTTAYGDHHNQKHTLQAEVHQSRKENGNENTIIAKESESNTAEVIQTPSDEQEQKEVVHDTELNGWELAKLATGIAPLWFLTEYFTNAALARTTVASTTLLISTSGPFTLFIGVILGQDSINLAKVISVFISVGGVAMTSLGKTWIPDSKTHSQKAINQKDSLIGNLFALLSAITYGFFTVLLKKYAGGEHGNKVDVQKLYGFIGLFTLIALWWLAWPLNALGIEPRFLLPGSTKTEEILLANCFVGSFISDYLWGLGVIWTTPLVAALGISLTIPLAMLEDILIHKHRYSAVYILGSIQVFFGFIMANFSDWFSEKLKFWK